MTRPSEQIATALIAALIVAVAAGCEDRSLPTAPDTRSATFTIVSAATVATDPRAVGQFTYRMPVTLRETTGVGAFISRVTATLTESSGATIVAELSSAEVFGTARIGANGTLVSTGVALTGPPRAMTTVTGMTVRVTFVDDNGNTGSVETSSGVRLDLTGDWVHRFFIQTQPPEDWILARVSLAQSGDSLTGEIVSRAGLQLPLTGSVTGSSNPPSLRIGGMPTGSSGCNTSIGFREFEFINGRAVRGSGIYSGRCPGTTFLNFEMQRSL